MNIKYTIIKNEMATTAEDAKYLGRAIPNGVRNRSQMIANILKTEHFAESTFNAVLDAAVAESAELCASGRDADWGAVKFIAKMHGSFPCEDSAFADGTAYLTVDADATNTIRTQLEKIVPEKMSAAEVAASIQVSNEMDVATEQFGVVIASTQFVILGNGMTLDGEGEYAKALDKKTGEVKGTATVQSVSKGQRAYCKFSPQLTGGDYTLEVATKGLVGETTPRIFRKPISAVYIAPTITKVRQEEQTEDDVVSAYAEAAITLTGVNLPTNDGVAVKLKWKDREDNPKQGATTLTSKSATQFVCNLTAATVQTIADDGVEMGEEMTMMIVNGTQTLERTVTRGAA